MAITDWPAAERPRGKLLERGPTAQSDAELLAILLRTGLCAVVGLGGASVHPREVVREALARNAAAVILATITRRAWPSRPMRTAASPAA